MLKRTVIVTSPARCCLKNRQLVCEDDETKIKKTAPIEDLAVVLVENQRASLSIPLLNALADNNVAVVFCDSCGMPNAQLVSFSASATQSEVFRAQMSASVAKNKRIWKQLVEAKIRNQSRLLEKLGKDGMLLRPYYENVKSGDADNREGIAARLYWRELFGDGFSRLREGPSPNNMLNYGYAILRSSVARALLCSGLNLALSVFHKNRYNPIPLVDDIMEPFRPFVDEIVYELVRNGECELNTEIKGYLAGVLSCDTKYDKLRRPLQIGLSITTASLAKCYLEDTAKLSLPSLEV